MSILLCLLSFLLNLNGPHLGTDGSLQKVFASDEHREPLLLLFMCATTLGFSFLPNLIIETLQTKSTEEGTDSFILERYLFILSSTMPSLVGLCGVFYEYEHTADFYIVTTSISIITLMYVTIRVLERRTYTKIWTRNVILGLFLINSIFLSVVIPFHLNFTMKKIFGVFVVIVMLRFYVKYLNIMSIKKVLFDGSKVTSWMKT